MSGSVGTIPLIASPQTLSISLAGVTYNLKIKWNSMAQCWIMDISDISDNLILGGVPLLPTADLLAQYQYLGIGGQMVVQTSNDPYAPPTFTNLGTDANLYFVT